MNLGIMTAEAQRQAIGPAAHHGDIFRLRRTRRLGQLHRLARSLRPPGAEVHLELSIARNRAHGGTEHALERFRRRVAALTWGR